MHTVYSIVMSAESIDNDGIERREQYLAGRKVLGMRRLTNDGSYRA